MIIESTSVSSLFMMVRGENFLPIIAFEGFQHIGIFQLFEVKLESRVFWLADFFQVNVESHYQQVVVVSNVCSWKPSCSRNVHF